MSKGDGERQPLLKKENAKGKDKSEIKKEVKEKAQSVSPFGLFRFASKVDILCIL